MSDRALSDLVRTVHPGATLIAVSPLGVDDAAESATEKSAGYGVPLKLTVQKEDGSTVDLVFRTATANVFGHDWRADRAAEMILAFDTFPAIPDHITAIDVGALAKQGDAFVSLRDAGEFYLLTSYVEGALYASDLRRIARDASLSERDRKRSRHLARWLAKLHTKSDEPGSIYARSIRDVVGSGEGIFGIIDGYPPDTPAANRVRLNAIEQQCVQWRWRLRQRSDRLCRIHGDFHPFNILFDGDNMNVLDASRGSLGDPANDVACMAINYVFFALERADAWQQAFRELWYSFWAAYFEERNDDELYDVLAPYLVWRLLVLCNPLWYPALSSDHRDRLLALAERTLAADRFDPEDAERVFADQEPGA